MKYPVALLVVLLLTSVYAQELIVDTINNAYNSGTFTAKSWSNPQWNNVLDFAIYGWMKIGSSYAKNEWATAVHFGSNANWENNAKYGDRVISLWTINNMIHAPTYSIARSLVNYVSDNVLYQPADLDKWAFFYIAHGSAQQAQFVYYRLAASGEKTLKYTQITHSTSNIYQIRVGQSFSAKYFPGSLWRVSIIAGQNAYRESGFDTLQNMKPDLAPSCVTVYTGCAYTGAASSVCQNVPDFNVSTIKSIFIPSGYTLTVYDTANYAGKKITYNQSIECITAFNWAMLVNTNAITVEDVKPALRKSSKRHH